MRKWLHTVGMMFLLLLLIACDREQAPDCFQRAGEMHHVTRELDAFSSVHISDLFQVELVDTPWTGVQLSGPKNLLPEIQTDVSDGWLTISNGNTCNFMRSYDHQLSLRICSPELKEVQNFGTGRIFNVDTLHGETFKLENRSASGQVNLWVDMDSLIVASHTGVADVQLNGRARVANLFNQGIGRFQAAALNSTHVYANNSSIQDMFIRCSGYLFARIDFSGNIYYEGTPMQVDEDLRSNGRLLPMPQ